MSPIVNGCSSRDIGKDVIARLCLALPEGNSRIPQGLTATRPPRSPHVERDLDTTHARVRSDSPCTGERSNARRGQAGPCSSEPRAVNSTSPRRLHLDLHGAALLGNLLSWLANAR